MLWKRQIPILIATIVGLSTLFGWFIDHPTIESFVNDDATQWSSVKKEGDIIGYHNDGIVKWSGVFSQAEYSNGMLSAFLNI